VENSLTVRISAQDNGASSSVEALNQRLTMLEQAYMRAGTATTSATTSAREHAAAQGETAVAAERSAGALGTLAEGMSTLATHSRTAAIALEQVGLEADAGATRLAGFAEVLEHVGSAVPELLAIGAAIAVASAVFLTLKDAIDEAARSEREMVTIGALLKNQGSSEWQTQAKEVDEYATALARAGTFAKDDYLKGIQAMLTAGMSLNDALRSQAAATDLAAAKNISLESAEEELASAYNGRMRGLTQLGIVTRDEMKTGLDYETVLQRIGARLGGTDAAALDAYTGKMENLHNVVGLAEEGIGSALLPALEGMADDMRSGVDALQPLVDDFQSWAERDMPNLQDGIHGVADEIGALANTALPALEHGTENTLDALAKFGKWVGDNKDAINTFFTYTVGVAAVAAMWSLGTAAKSAIGSMMASSWWTMITWGFEALTSGIWANVASWAALVAEETVATFGLNLVVGALVAGAFWVFTHWSETTTALTGWFKNIAEAGLNMAANIEGSFGRLFDSLANMAANVPLVGGKIRDALSGIAQHFRDQANDHRTASLVLSGAFGPGSDTSEADFRNRDSGYTKGYGKQKKTKAKAPPTTASHHHIQGTATAKPHAPGETTTSFTPAEIKPEKIDIETAAQKLLAEQLKRVDDAEKGLAESIKTATTVEAQRIAQAAYDAQVTVDLIAKKRLLTETIGGETSEQRELTAEHDRAVQAAKAATDAYNAYGNAINTGGKQSIDEQNHLAVLKDTMDKATKSTEDLKTRLDELAKNLATNRDSLAALNVQLDAFVSKSEETAAAAARSWEEYQKKTADTLREDLATHDMSNAEKLAHYGQMLAQMEALDTSYHAQHLAALATLQAAEKAGDADRVRSATAALEQIDGAMTDNEKRMEAVDGQYTSSYKAALADQENAQKAYLAKVQGYETTFLDSILQKHQGLRTSIHEILGQMLSDWVQYLEQMIIKSTMLDQLTSANGPFGKLLQSVGLGAALATGSPGAAGAATIPGGSGGGNVVSAVSQFGIAGLLGPSAGSQIASSTVNSAQTGGVLATQIGTSGSQQVANALTTSTSAATSAAGQIDTSSMGAASWATDIYTPYETSGLTTSSVSNSLQAGGNGFSMPSSSKPSAASDILNGYAIGSSMQFGSGQNDSQWGGMLGGVAAAVTAANPLAGLALDVGGSVIGSLFGSHQTAADQPDLNNASYGGDLAAWQGANVVTGANTNIVPGQYNTSNGGTSLSADIAAWEQSSSGNVAGLTAAQQQLYQQILGMMGGNANAGAGALGITNEKNGVVTFNDGTTMSVTQWQQMLNTYNSVVGSSPANSPVFQMTRTYPNMNIGQLSQTGTYTPSTVTMNNGVATNTSGGYTPIPTPTPTPATTSAPSVVVTVQGNLVGQDGMNQLTQTIATGLRNLQINLVPGSTTAWGAASTSTKISV
jgi:hypothetical protein